MKPLIGEGLRADATASHHPPAAGVPYGPLIFDCWLFGYSWVDWRRGVVRAGQVLRAVKRSLGVGTDLLDPGVGLG